MASDEVTLLVVEAGRGRLAEAAGVAEQGRLDDEAMVVDMVAMRRRRGRTYVKRSPQRTYTIT